MKAPLQRDIWPKRLIPIILLLLAAFLRFAGLGAVRHSYDNGYQIYDAVRLLDGGQWLLIGQPSSIFLDNPPLMAYLLSLPLLIWRSPWAPYLLVTALNTVAVLFVYHLARDLKGRSFALLAALFFAANPWVVHYSRFTWTQGLMPVFLAVAAWGLWPAIVHSNRGARRLFAGLLAVAAMVYSYVLALVILAPVGLLLLLFRRRLPARPVAAGLLVLLLALLAYGGGLATRAQQNLDKLSLFTTQEEAPATALSAEALQHSVRLVTGLHYQAPGESSLFPAPLNTAIGAAHLFLLAALVAGIVRALLALRQEGKQRRLALVLLIWWLLPTAGFTLLPFPVHPHYLLPTMPAGQLLAAWGLLPLTATSRLRLALAPLLLLLLAIFTYALQSSAAIAAAQPAPSDNLQHWTLDAAARLGLEVRRAVLAPGNRDGYPLRVSAPGDDVAIGSAAATYLENIDDLAYPEFVLLAARDHVLYVLLNRDPQPAALGPHERVMSGDARLPGDRRLSFAGVDPTTRDQALALPQEVVDWGSESGLTLLGYDLAPATEDATRRLTTYWRVDELSPDRAEWFVAAYYQILTREWQMVANIAGHGQWARRWQLGDIYIERIDLPLTPDAEQHQLLIGLNDTIHGQPYAFFAPQGVEPYLTLPLTAGVGVDEP